MSDKEPVNQAEDTKNPQQPEAKWVDTGSSWLAVIVFLFTSGYLQKVLGETIFDINFIMYVIIGSAVAKVVLDLPSRLLHGYIIMSIVKDKTGAELIRAMNKAGVVGTFIKAAVVVITYVAAKYAFQEIFQPALNASA